MSTLEKLVELLIKFEGMRLTAYQCPAGIWTIGAGITGSDVVRGLVWTRDYALERLKKRAQQSIDELLIMSPSLINESVNRQAALASFCFNLGRGSYQASTLKKSVDAGNWKEAKKQILRWDKCRVDGELVELAGLTKRRSIESKMLV